MACSDQFYGEDVCFSGLSGYTLTGTIASAVTKGTSGSRKDILGADGNTATIYLTNKMDTIEFEAILLTADGPTVEWGDSATFNGIEYLITKADYIYKSGEECRIAISGEAPCGIALSAPAP